MFWSEDRIEQLRSLINDDRALSASAIGAELDITRSAVIGKASRLGLRLANGHGMRPPGSPPKRKPKTTWFAKTVQPAPYVEPLASVVEPPLNAKHLTLLELDWQHCRWPVTNDSPFLFCALPRIEGSSYCKHHVVRATNNGKAVRINPFWQQFVRAA